VVGVVKETVAGTFIEPGATDTFHAVNIQFTPTQQNFDRKDTASTFGIRDSIPGSGEGDISFELPLCGAAAAGTAPFWGTLMRACGHSETTVAVTSVTYAPTSIFTGLTVYPSEGYSVSVWTDDKNAANGLQLSLTGCQGNVQISTKQGEPLIGKFKFHGAYQVVANDVQPVVTDATLSPPIFLGATMTVHAVNTLAFDGFEFDKGNVINKRGDVSAASGVRSAWITGHKPMIKISPEMVLTTTLDYYGRWRAGTTGNFIASLAGAGVPAGSKMVFTAGRTQFKDLTMADREGAATADLGLQITTAANAADGADYSLVLT